MIFWVAGEVVKQLNIYDFYDLGKALTELQALNNYTEAVELKEVIWTLWSARWRIQRHVIETTVLLPGSRRSAGALLRLINAIIPADDKIFEADNTVKVTVYELGQVVSALTDFETVMKNDMPEMATFAVPQLGIYRTENLIDHADQHIHEDLRKFLPVFATQDIIESGRCLGFRVPTASAFHISRALETVMNEYHKALTGKSFADAKVVRNWGKYIEALRTAKAPDKITKFLDHFREEYRNPITHPEEIVDAQTAFNLFGAALSAISQILVAIQEIDTAKKEAEQKKLQAAATIPSVPIGLPPIPLPALSKP